MQASPGAFPSCWASSQSPSLSDLIDGLRKALHDELKSRRLPHGRAPLTVPLRNGRVEARAGQHARVRFHSPALPSDGLLDDTHGQVSIDGSQYACLILGLCADQLTLGIAATLHDFIPQAHLTIDRLRLLLALDRRLAKIQAHPQEYLTRLALKCFSPHATPTHLPDQVQMVPDEPLNPAQLNALVRALTHDFLFLWGPPGTGKTKVIGALVRQAMTQGHRVLLCSNTNAAVDQTLEAVLGPISTRVTPGSILRYGVSEGDAPAHLAPLTVDALAASTRSRLTTQLDTLQAARAAVQVERTHLRDCLTLQEELTTLTRDRQQNRDEIAHLTRQLEQASLAKEAADAYAAALTLERRTITSSGWMRRLFLRPLATVEDDLEYATTVIARQATALTELHATLASSQTRERAVQAHRQVVLATFATLLGNRRAEGLKTALTAVDAQERGLHQEITACQQALATVESRLIQDAEVLATTLTSTYTASALARERFDLVIIDEGSMASPPALFAACCLARRQVVIVGDFFQLPPIADAPTDQAQQWLGRDIYQVAQIHGDQDRRVAALSTQYRMHRDIAALAARLYQRAGLAYRTDPGVLDERQPIVDLAPAPGHAVVFVNTTPGHPWIDKDPKGSPGNRYHAHVAVQLAQHLLSRDPSGHLRLSLIAPYRHQIRLLKDLAHQANLTDRVRIGTIHSVQGQQSDVVIFDSTVTGDLTRTMLGRAQRGHSPCKLLNVAFTRAQSKLIVIGDRAAVTTLSRLPHSLLWDCLSFSDAQGSVVDATTVVAPFDRERPPAATMPTAPLHPPIPMPVRRLYTIRSM